MENLSNGCLIFDPCIVYTKTQSGTLPDSLAALSKCIWKLTCSITVQLNSPGRSGKTNVKRFWKVMENHFQCCVCTLCEEYQELTPLIYTTILYTGLHVIKWASKKNWPKNFHQVFRVCSGRSATNYDMVLGVFEGGKKNFDPISPPLQVRGHWNFSAW